MHSWKRLNDSTLLTRSMKSFPVMALDDALFRMIELLLQQSPLGDFSYPCFDSHPLCPGRRTARTSHLELERRSARTYKLPACAAAVMEEGHLAAIGAGGRMRRADANVPVTTADTMAHRFLHQKHDCSADRRVGWMRGSCAGRRSVADIFRRCATGWLAQDHRVGCSDPTQRLGIAVAGGNLRSIEGGQRQCARTRVPPLHPACFWRMLPWNRGTLTNTAMPVSACSGRSLTKLPDAVTKNCCRRISSPPLGLKTAGFGAPGDAGKTGSGRGDIGGVGTAWSLSRIPTPLRTHFPRCCAPAPACVHMVPHGFAPHYAWWFVERTSGESCSRRTLPKLRTPPEGSSYAGGVWKTELPGVGGEAVCHTGHLGGFLCRFLRGAQCRLRRGIQHRGRRLGMAGRRNSPRRH